MNSTEMLAELQAVIEAKNTIPIDQFVAYWAPLFRQQGYKELGEHEYMRRVQKYREQIDVYSPVKIVATKDDKPVVVAQIPPMATRLGMIDPNRPISSGLKGSDVIGAFQTALKRADNPNSGMPEATNMLMEAIGQTVDREQVWKDMQLVQQADEALGRPGPLSNAPSAKALSDDDWKDA